MIQRNNFSVLAALGMWISKQNKQMDDHAQQRLLKPVSYHIDEFQQTKMRTTAVIIWTFGSRERSQDTVLFRTAFA